MDEKILRVAKEIAVKFIEVGRISPTNFPESFDSIYTAVKATVERNREAGSVPPQAKAAKPKAPKK